MTLLAPPKIWGFRPPCMMQITEFWSLDAEMYGTFMWFLTENWPLMEEILHFLCHQVVAQAQIWNAPQDFTLFGQNVWCKTPKISTLATTEFGGLGIRALNGYSGVLSSMSISITQHPILLSCHLEASPQEKMFGRIHTLWHSICSWKRVPPMNTWWATDQLTINLGFGSLSSPLNTLFPLRHLGHLVKVDWRTVEAQMSG